MACGVIRAIVLENSPYLVHGLWCDRRDKLHLEDGLPGRQVGLSAGQPATCGKAVGRSEERQWARKGGEQEN